MPELAEVEYYRKVWNPGIGQRVLRVSLHPGTRVFRGTSGQQLEVLLPGRVLLHSEARGKQMLFTFSENTWLGLHLGMTGQLKLGPPDLRPDKHEHLVLHQLEHSLIFRDPRQFGRVRLHTGAAPPEWWNALPLAVTGPAFTRAHMRAFLSRHKKLTLKAALLLQSGFPGVGNWMADEILWRAQLHPRLAVGQLVDEEMGRLWRGLRFVCRHALKHVGHDFSDPPSTWFFHERWQPGGRCPVHGGILQRDTIGGRTTAWCEPCQPARRGKSPALERPSTNRRKSEGKSTGREADWNASI